MPPIRKENASRAHVVFEVFTGGAKKSIELPFVIGVCSDLAGASTQKQPPMSDREFERVGENGLSPLFNKYRPRVKFSAPNKIDKDGDPLSVDLEFESIGDFDPASVARRHKVLQKFIQEREALLQLKSNLDGNDDAKQVLADILKKLKDLTSKPA